MLAMVLCFTGCDEPEDFQRGVEEYNEEADISQANANAKIVYTAVSSYLSEYPDTVIYREGFNYDLGDSKNDGKYYFTFDGITICDLSDYFGKKYEGYCNVYFTDSGTIQYAIWTGNYGSMYEATYYDRSNPLTYSDLEMYHNLGYVVGCYPIAPEDNYFDY